uniref:hypothetical protein n=1 Tax=Aliarcobacter sp. TaxID=2321116 RepID=UPI00404733F9
MKGKILDYSIQNSTGIISGDDGIRYQFSNSQWKSDKAPTVNQKVDFIIENNEAKEIYLEISSGINTDEIKSRINEIQGSEKIKDILSNGIQYKFGFFLSIAILLGLFLPVIEIPYVGEGALIDDGFGKITFLATLGISFLFFSGIQDKLLKTLTIIVSIVILYSFISLFLGLNDTESMLNSFAGRNFNLFELLSYGTYIMLPLTIVLLISGLKLKPNQK